VSIGDRIKQVRTQKGFSTYDISEKTGVSQSTISKLENNKRKADYEILIKISKALNVDIEDFFKEDHPTQCNHKIMDEIIKENDIIEKEIKSLYPKIAKMSPEKRKALSQIIDALLGEDDPQK
jgi:transcriptional regulator with XRE-family HTH domain